MPVEFLHELPLVPNHHESLTLADRMKQYEASSDYRLPLSAPVILRLDGHGFSRFTAPFCRPFDPRIHDAMIATCSDLLHYFPQATVAYTQSDEITLVFPQGVQSFNQRVQKLSSLAASYCSVRFNAHLAALLAANPEPQVEDAAYRKLGTAHFDARFFAVPLVEEPPDVRGRGIVKNDILKNKKSDRTGRLKAIATEGLNDIMHGIFRIAISIDRG